MNIIHRSGKITQKYLFELDENSTTLDNVLRQPKYKTSKKYHTEYAEKCFWKFAPKETFDRLGKPNLTMQHYESAPGVWILDDLKTNIVWIIWSDLHHKHYWKGTSFEVCFPEDREISDDEFVDSLKRLYSFLK